VSRLPSVARLPGVPAPPRVTGLSGVTACPACLPGFA